jgi:hypothetical protein
MSFTVLSDEEYENYLKLKDFYEEIKFLVNNNRIETELIAELVHMYSSEEI